jgi:two-component system response regulator FixJ
MPSPREYTIYVVVDDDAVRDSICVLMESLGFGTCAFGSANALLRGDRMAVKSCLIVDDALPGVSGFELLDRLRSEGLQAPAIVITQRVSAGAQAASDRVGALLLQKPYTGDKLIGCLVKAFARDRDTPN